jgi:MFS family permease
MKNDSVNTCCGTALPTLVPFFAIVNLALMVITFIAASYFMAKGTFLEILRWIAWIQPWINFALIGLSLVLMALGQIHKKRWLVTWGLRCANCVATLGIAAGVLVVIGATQGGVDYQVLHGLYFWQPWFLIFYAIFVGFHAGLQSSVSRAERSEQ